MIYTVTLNPAVDRELTVPEFAFDSVLRATETRVDCGGKGFNVSRMLAELGSKSVALGFAGGRSGELLRDGLTDLGIATDFVWVNGETRTNVSVVTAVPTHYLKVNEAGPTISAAEQAALLDKIDQLAQPGDWWVLGGSLPPGVPKSIYGNIIERVQQAGGKAILDTSGEALRLGCGQRPFLIKPNDYEAGQLTNLPVTTADEIATAAQALQKMGADNVVISLGKAGALLASDNAIHHGAAPKIQEMNPIGAGDALVGGLVWAMANEHPLGEALRWGLATGSATAAQAGTAVGPRELVETLVKQVRTIQMASYTIRDEKKYSQDTAAVYQAALGAVGGLEGKMVAQDAAAGTMSVKFHKTILGKVLGDRTHMNVKIGENGGETAVFIEIYPLNAVGQPLKFGARKGVSRTVANWFYAHLEHRLK